MLDELEHNAKVVAPAAGPRPCEVALQLVRPEPGIECVRLQQAKRVAQRLRRVRMPLEIPLGGPDECCRPDEGPPHDVISVIRASAVVDLTLPAANSARASWTSAATRRQPSSAMRRRTTSIKSDCWSSGK